MRWLCAALTLFAVLGSGCTRPKPRACEAMRGRWIGDSVEGGTVSQPTLRAIMATERWTFTETHLERDGQPVESLHILDNRPDLCVIEMTKNDGTKRTMHFRVDADGKLRAWGNHQRIRVVLRRLQ